MKPWQTGLAFGITVALFYTLCTLVEALLPNQFMEWMSALFHGLDFGKLSSAVPWRATSYLYAVTVLSGWAFAFGTVFTWLHQRLGGVKKDSVVRRG